MSPAIRKKKPKLLAVDLDGTLLDPSGAPHARDVEAIRAVQALGVIVTIVTGRLYSGARRAAEVCGIRGPVACVDGSHVVRADTHKTVFHHGIRGHHATKLRETFARRGPAAFVFARDAVIHDDAGAPYLSYVATWSTELTRTERVTTHHAWEHEDGVTAIVAVGSMQQIVGAAEDIHRDLPGATQVATFPTRRGDTSWGMVVRATGGDKGTALAWLADHHGLGIEETVAVGDWMNDVPMLERAGRSFAMGQAPALVKEKATDRLTETCETGGGVARAIEIAFGVKV